MALKSWVRSDPGKNQMSAREVDILPGVSVLALMRHLNYKPWYALAEFVDNSVQSYSQKSHEIRKADGPEAFLRVDISYDATDDGFVTIRDNAGGISDRDYDRAFKTAELPPDVSGLAEFGIGMKSAATWFGNRWSVRSKAIGEAVERTVTFDIDAIVARKVAALPVREVAAKRTEHYTEITLSNLNHQLRGRTLAKVKDHLTDIFRQFTRVNALQLTLNGEVLEYREPRILKAADYRDPDGAKRFWRKDFEISLPHNRRVFGFAALREVASTSNSGFAVFRRKRLIQGSGDEGYRPLQIFHRPNSYTFQRLFGELNVDGFDVTHTKDNIQWGDDEDLMIQKLQIELNKTPLTLLDQSEGYRARVKSRDVATAAVSALSGLKSVASQLGTDLATGGDVTAPESPPPTSLRHTGIEPFTEGFDLQVGDTLWHVAIEATTDPSVGDWLELSQAPEIAGKRRLLGIRIALAHPFMQRFALVGQEQIAPLVRIGVGIALAEAYGRDGGIKQVGFVRRKLNELLRGGLADARV